MSLVHAGSLPLISPPVIRQLEVDLGERGPFLAFIRSFTDMWPSRFQRLSGAVHSGDTTVTVDALLSLQTSSGMIGASRLAELCLELDNELRLNIPTAAEILVDIHICGDATTELLRTDYLVAGAKQ